LNSPTAGNTYRIYRLDADAIIDAAAELLLQGAGGTDLF
jgi:hypothetical protein